MKMSTPMEKRFQEIHSGHLIFVKPEERRFVTEDLIKSHQPGRLRVAEIIDKLKALEEAGATSIVFRLTGTDGRELISEIGREVIARY